MPEWRESLEVAIVDRLKTESAFAYVAVAALQGGKPASAWPAVIVSYAGMNVEEASSIAGAHYERGPARFLVTIGVRASSGSGDARLGVSGAYAMLDKAFRKLAGFMPTIAGIDVIEPIAREDEGIYEIEGTLVSLDSMFRLYIQEMNPAS